MSAIAWVDEPHWNDAGDMLLASVALPPVIRTPARNGDTRVEVEIHGSDAETRVEQTLSALQPLIDRLPSLTTEALRLAPTDWRRDYSDEDLWLTGIEFHPDKSARLLYDFGALDLLVLEIDDQGDSSVSIEP